MTESVSLTGNRTAAAEKWRRSELAMFLRSRRARLSPAEHGLAETRRRRTS